MKTENLLPKAGVQSHPGHEGDIILTAFWALKCFTKIIENYKTSISGPQINILRPKVGILWPRKKIRRSGGFGDTFGTWNTTEPFVGFQSDHVQYPASDIPTGGPAGTTHFFSGRGTAGVAACLAAASSSSPSTLSSCRGGKGTWCTRKWEPSEGRGTFWNAMWGLGFSYGTTTTRHKRSSQVKSCPFLT